MGVCVAGVASLIGVTCAAAQGAEGGDVIAASRFLPRDPIYHAVLGIAGYS